MIYVAKKEKFSKEEEYEERPEKNQHQIQIEWIVKMFSFALFFAASKVQRQKCSVREAVFFL